MQLYQGADISSIGADASAKHHEPRSPFSTGANKSGPPVSKPNTILDLVLLENIGEKVPLPLAGKRLNIDYGLVKEGDAGDVGAANEEGLVRGHMDFQANTFTAVPICLSLVHFHSLALPVNQGLWPGWASVYRSGRVLLQIRAWRRQRLTQ